MMDIISAIDPKEFLTYMYNTQINSSINSHCWHRGVILALSPGYPAFA